MGLFSAIDTSASGLTAEMLRMDVIADNIANVNTTRTDKGGPYYRKNVIFTPKDDKPKFNIPFVNQTFTEPGRGVRVIGIEEDRLSPLRLEYRPEHPDADKNGYVHFPNVNIVTEMTDMITATRAYEANISAIRDMKQMMMKAIDIGK